MAKKKPDLAGIIPAIVLPMTEDYKVDEATLRDYVDWIIPQGIKALAIDTDAGEGPHLGNDEKLRILDVVVKQVAGRVPVVCGVGAPYTAAAVDFAKAARDTGADAFLCFPITAFRGATGRDPVILKYHEALAKVGVPMIIFTLQPDLGGVDYPPETLTALVEIDEVCAIKEATFDALKYVQTLAHLNSLPKHITLLTGNDNFIYESFVLGGEGALIGFGAIATGLQVDMLQAARAKRFDEAARLNDLLMPLVNTCFGQPVRDYRARIKEGLVMQGVLKNAVVRPPLLPVDDAARAQVRKALVHAGLL
ncbi:MAG: dihydrodipicolinate synthase family protein [Bacillota bacterium]